MSSFLNELRLKQKHQFQWVSTWAVGEISITDFFCLILWTTKQVGGFQGENRGFSVGDSLLTLTVRVHWRQHAKERLWQWIADVVSSCRYDGQLESLWSRWSRPSPQPSLTFLSAVCCVWFFSVFFLLQRPFYYFASRNVFPTLVWKLKPSFHTDSQEQIGPYNCFPSV